ncbi:MAG: NFACT family protein [Nitrospirota bacterium]
MKFLNLFNIVQELALLLSDSRVQRVYQGAEGNLYLILHREKKNFFLLLSPDRAVPRLHLVSVKPTASFHPNPFALFLKSHIAGTRIAAITLLNEDRIVEIRFTGQDKAYRLVFELMGAFSNLLLCDDSSKILAVYYPSPATALRPLLPGFSYSLPEKKYKPGTVLKIDGYSKDETGISSNREAELFYQEQQEQRQFSLMQTRVSSCIRKALSKLERKITALTSDLDSAMRIEEYKQAGNLILANLRNLKTGMEQTELHDYEGKAISIVLDPRLSPQRNADRYFKKYKKMKAGYTIISQRLAEAKKEFTFLNALQSDLAQAQGYDDVMQIQSRLASRGYWKIKKEATSREQTPSFGYKKILFQGWEILVGKSAKGNDYITTGLASPDDIWLHAEGMPGSHVLIRNPHKADIPDDVLVKAAAFAAFHSKGKNAGKVSVTYTQARFVKKPKGAKPGLVTLTERKSIMVRPEGEK